MKRWSLLLGLCFTVLACSEDTAEYTAVPTPVTLEIPDNFPAPLYDFETNPLTEEGIALGKSLFYDGQLSSTGVISCGFCHEQAFSFTHHGHTVSHGVNGLEGFRNSQPLHNLAFAKEFNWDGAAIHLDLQPIIPITAEVEMDETIPNVLSKLKASPEYPKLFRAAFGTDSITSERMLKALSQFMLQMVSGNSKYDKYSRGEEGVTLTAAELAGEKLFASKCASCHTGSLFTDQTYRNNGLPFNTRFPEEEGRMRVSGYQEDYYKFRVPSLRNVEVSFPYMHDGRFATLEAVLNFYTDGMVDNGNVDHSLLQEDGRFGIALTDTEKHDIIQFLKTLTDHEFLQDERFAEF
ncbi:cytochrome-c peroxidase [Flavobacterium sp. ASW18X]|uniref:cytochrome-c peroxidase n=1 Tax=Flavobacterium sp. ASW18X TaxID=2572595 RepID=UPI0010AE9F2F|nr:cytochrome c peroxidase [Flavobacterium sp. ASW18X]TKD66285.1 cytochrome-c peroxidase [Flavobacterium sp. ASW18X]